MVYIDFGTNTSDIVSKFNEDVGGLISPVNYDYLAENMQPVLKDLIVSALKLALLKYAPALLDQFLSQFSLALDKLTPSQLATFELEEMGVNQLMRGRREDIPPCIDRFLSSEDPHLSGEELQFTQNRLNLALQDINDGQASSARRKIDDLLIELLFTFNRSDGIVALSTDSIIGYLERECATTTTLRPTTTTLRPTTTTLRPTTTTLRPTTTTLRPTTSTKELTSRTSTRTSSQTSTPTSSRTSTPTSSQTSTPTSSQTSTIETSIGTITITSTPSSTASTTPTKTPTSTQTTTRTEYDATTGTTTISSTKTTTGTTSETTVNTKTIIPTTGTTTQTTTVTTRPVTNSPEPRTTTRSAQTSQFTTVFINGVGQTTSSTRSSFDGSIGGHIPTTVPTVTVGGTIGGHIPTTEPITPTPNTFNGEPVSYTTVESTTWNAETSSMTQSSVTTLQLSTSRLVTVTSSPVTTVITEGTPQVTPTPDTTVSITEHGFDIFDQSNTKCGTIYGDYTVGDGQFQTTGNNYYESGDIRCELPENTRFSLNDNGQVDMSCEAFGQEIGFSFQGKNLICTDSSTGTTTTIDLTTPAPSNTEPEFIRNATAPVQGTPGTSGTDAPLAFNNASSHGDVPPANPPGGGGGTLAGTNSFSAISLLGIIGLGIGLLPQKSRHPYKQVNNEAVSKMADCLMEGTSVPDSKVLKSLSIVGNAPADVIQLRDNSLSEDAVKQLNCKEFRTRFTRDVVHALFHNAVLKSQSDDELDEIAKKIFKEKDIETKVKYKEDRRAFILKELSKPKHSQKKISLHDNIKLLCPQIEKNTVVDNDQYRVAETVVDGELENVQDRQEPARSELQKLCQELGLSNIELETIMGTVQLAYTVPNYKRELVEVAPGNEAVESNLVYEAPNLTIDFDLSKHMIQESAKALVSTLKLEKPGCLRSESNYHKTLRLVCERLSSIDAAAPTGYEVEKEPFKSFEELIKKFGEKDVESTHKLLGALRYMKWEGDEQERLQSNNHIQRLLRKQGKHTGTERLLCILICFGWCRVTMDETSTILGLLLDNTMTVNKVKVLNDLEAQGVKGLSEIATANTAKRAEILTTCLCCCKVKCRSVVTGPQGFGLWGMMGWVRRKCVGSR